jgi:hypothetical protein
MRKGNQPQLIRDDNGQIFAIATGSDACAEHESGTAALQHMFCVGTGTIDRYATRGPQDEAIIAKMRAGEAVTFPSVLERKSLRHNLAKLTFVKYLGPGNVAEAVFGYLPHGEHLHSTELSINPGRDMAGAWCENSFAFKVRGQKLVEQFEEFATKVMNGDGIFAGTFLSAPGVVVGLVSGITEHFKAGIEKAQFDYGSNLLLQSKSRLPELMQLYHHASEHSGNMHVRLPGYLWPVWSGVIGGEVFYALNPSHGVDATYYGPYPFDQLKDWVLSRNKFKLVPIRKAA